MSYALDCEMVATDKGQGLGRVSIVDGNGKVVFDQHCKPPGTVTDCLTSYSGITPSDLQNARPSHQVANEAKQILQVGNDLTFGLITTSQGKMVVGHDLESDFHALGFTCPNTFDTATAASVRRAAGLPVDGQKPSLKDIAKDLCGRLAFECDWLIVFDAAFFL